MPSLYQEGIWHFLDLFVFYLEASKGDIVGDVQLVLGADCRIFRDGCLPKYGIARHIDHPVVRYSDADGGEDDADIDGQHIGLGHHLG